MPSIFPGRETSGVSAVYANDADVRRTIDILRRLRFFRRQYDNRRAYYYRQYLGSRDRRLFPDNLTPRSNTFVPFPHRNVETVVAHTLDAFFSHDPAFEARKHGVTGSGDADAMQWVMLTGLRNAKWIGHFETLIRNICVYGFGAISVDWDWDTDLVDGPEPVYAMMPVLDQQGQVVRDNQGRVQFTGSPIINPMTGEPVQTGVQHMVKQVPRNRPRLQAIDIYDIMVDPDGGQIARLLEKTLAQIKREAANNPKLYDPQGVLQLIDSVTKAEPKEPDSVLIRLAELWDETQNTVTLITFGEDADSIAWKDLRYSYRNANYSAYKRKVYDGPPIKLYHNQNPFAHKRAPILYTSYTKLPNEVYGIGLIEKSSSLVDGVNTLTNMITDNWNIGINRRYAYDTQADIDHQALNEANTPGGKVGVTGDPNKVLAPLPFFTPNANDYQILELYKGMIDMVTGVSDFNSAANLQQMGGTAGAGIGMILSESNYLFKMFIRNLEVDILQPMLEMVASMYQQWGSDELEYEITGQPPEIPKYGRVKLENLLGSYDFDFVGANYATDKIVRQRNLMAYYNLASQTPYANQGPLLLEIAKSLNIPNASKLVKSDQQVAQEQMASQQSAAQMAVLEKLLDTESKTVIAQIRNAKQGDNSPGPRHGLAAQEEIERIIHEEVFERLGLENPPQASHAHHNPEGRPAKMQFEGKIPGGSVATEMKSIGQSQGANGLGLEGMR